MSTTKVILTFEVDGDGDSEVELLLVLTVGELVLV